MDDLIGESEQTYRLPSEDQEEGGSIVAEISKADLLELLEEDEPLSIDELEHSEDIGAWIATVRSWLEMTGLGKAEFFEIIRRTALNPVVVWTALLLGGFTLEKQGDFYRRSEKDPGF